MQVVIFCLSQLLLLSSLWAGEVKDGGVLFLGNRNIAPVVFLEDGRPVGVVVDIVRAMAPHLPRPIEIRAMDWQEAQALVARGEADALLQINPTGERLKIYDFSEPLLESRFSIFVAADRVGIAGITSLYGLTVGVESGGLPQLELAKAPQISLRIIPDFLEGFYRIIEGSLDAVVVDYRVGSYVLAEQKIRGIKVSGEPIAVSYSAIAVKKGDVELLGAINKALQSIRSDGSYQQALDKWKPTEAIFQTREQIVHKRYVIAFIGFFILLLIAVLWLVTLRRQLCAKKSAEERLGEQYSTLRGIIDSAKTPIFSVDSRYCYTSFNKSHATVMENIYGARITLGQRLLDYMTVPEDREIAKRNLDRALAGESFMTEAYSGETHRLRQYFQVSHNPVRDEEGTIIGIAVLVQDLTKSKQLEEENRANLYFFENMDRVNRAIQGEDNLEEMMGGVLDEVLAIFDCDRAYLFFPCDPEAASCTVPMESYKPDYPGAHSGGLALPVDQELADKFRILLDSKDPVKFGPKNENTPLPPQISEQFGIRSMLATVLYPRVGKPWEFGIQQCSRARDWTDEEVRFFREIGRRLGDALSILLTYRDLRESEKRFSTLVNQASDPFFVHNLEGHFLDVNQRACESLGYTREELLGMSVVDVDAEFISHDHVRKFWSKLQPGQPVTLNGVHKRKDGTRFPVEVRLGLLQLEDRQVLLALARDITERKEAEESLRQLNDALESRVRERTAELEAKNEELERMNQHFVGRELKMVELKKKIRVLERDHYHD
jgi:PAS domain S-box-containing protein